MGRILLAEDDEPVRAFVARALTLDGHTVVAEPDGAAALARLEADPVGFDLLLSDIRMPVMDGVALALAAARDAPALPVVLMTGYADQRERAHDLLALIEDVVTKPFTIEELRGAVRGALERRAVSPFAPVA